MGKYGKVFKIIRESKNMSLKEVAGDFVTPAQLSRFENGKSNLSVDIFFYCLGRMDILQGEFSTFYSSYFQDEDVRLSLELRHALENRNISYLQRKIQEYEKKVLKHNSKSDRVLIAVFHSMINKCDSNITIPDTEKQIIADYLMSINEWCFYELWILGTCSRALSTRALELLGTELVSRTQFYNGIEENRRRVYRILLNLASELLNRGEERVAASFIRKLDNLNILEQDIFERLQLKFLKSHFNYLQGNARGLKEMKECQRIAEFLDCYDISRQIEATISKFTDM
ncbi:Rgg/GadR/MutR family transcriptional regulator [Streptococcus halichoeri]|uniref:Rgg/GadR/MutR family transcriptional regulator n=1 Tax=Streptococcus halichoeri TaxID=254785 RepID=UPI001C8EAFE8|nr:Rgg/GadR/MutR family transcriptional regulator [Streptococcus halichoeri]